MRPVVLFCLLVIVLSVGAIYIAYGEVEPCRVLAVEKSRRAVGALTTDRADVEALMRAQTSQMKAGACVSELLDSWGGRFKT